MCESERHRASGPQPASRATGAAQTRPPAPPPPRPPRPPPPWPWRRPRASKAAVAPFESSTPRWWPRGGATTAAPPCAALCGRARRLVRPHGLGGGGGDVRAAPARPSRGPRRSRDAQPRLRGGKCHRRTASARRARPATEGGRGARAGVGEAAKLSMMGYLRLPQRRRGSHARASEEICHGCLIGSASRAAGRSRSSGVPFADERRGGDER